MATKTELLTADDLLRLYSKGVRGELIQGVLCETMPLVENMERLPQTPPSSY